MNSDTDTTDQSSRPLENPTSHLTRMLTPEEIEDLIRDSMEADKLGEEYFKKHPLK